MMKLSGPFIFAPYLVLMLFKTPNYQIFLVLQLCQGIIKKIWFALKIKKDHSKLVLKSFSWPFLLILINMRNGGDDTDFFQLPETTNHFPITLPFTVLHHFGGKIWALLKILCIILRTKS